MAKIPKVEDVPCEACKCTFPPTLVRRLVLSDVHYDGNTYSKIIQACPICALEHIREHTTAPGFMFKSTNGKRRYEDAKAHLRNTNQQRPVKDV